MGRSRVSWRLKIDASKVDLPPDLLWRAIDLMRRTSSSLQTRASVIFATQIAGVFALAAATSHHTGVLGSGAPNTLGILGLVFLVVGAALSFEALYPSGTSWDELADLPPRLAGKSPSEVEEQWTREQFIALVPHLHRITQTLRASVIGTALGLILTALAFLIGS